MPSSSASFLISFWNSQPLFWKTFLMLRKGLGRKVFVGRTVVGAGDESHVAVVGVMGPQVLGQDPLPTTRRTTAGETE
jgi:hypothetical protein